jgi:hypothetical protein
VPKVSAAAELSRAVAAALGGEDVSRDMSRTEQNQAQLSDTQTTA